MVFRRPSSQQIAARKAEIARRYARKSKVSRRSRGMAAIRIAELMRWQADGDREIDGGLARIFVHHFLCLQHGDRRASEWLHRYCPDMPARDREYLISEATNCPLKWSADKLAWKLRLTDADRTRLRITTIGAVDCNREQRAQRRKERDAERKRLARAAKPKPAPRPHHID